ncbi:hypothetical protein JOB18_048615 [Solea senegalensis]|uniref:Uncharacterized protein n=1 Tax=Solea senegalensis TaxID=28829 RepID=A0AAV6R0U9_SOLSE|nr:hypothetical protein JOB18_048615 [Solea senegalensis]
MIFVSSVYTNLFWKLFMECSGSVQHGDCQLRVGERCVVDTLTVGDGFLEFQRTISIQSESSRFHQRLEFRFYG